MELNRCQCSRGCQNLKTLRSCPTLELLAPDWAPQREACVLLVFTPGGGIVCSWECFVGPMTMRDLLSLSNRHTLKPSLCWRTRTLREVFGENFTRGSLRCKDWVFSRFFLTANDNANSLLYHRICFFPNFKVSGHYVYIVSSSRRRRNRFRRDYL